MASMYRIQTAIDGLPGGSGLATFHFLASGGSGQEAQVAIDSAWSSLASHILLGITLRPLNEVVTFEDTTGVISSVAATLGSTVNGSQTGEPLPYATAGLLRWRTNTVVDGRRLQGRTFMPNPGETNSGSGGKPVAGYLVELAAFGTAMIDNSTSTLAIWSRPTPSRAGSSGAVISAQPWSEFAVLRSRRS